MLMQAVRTRYAERSSLLDVASVTANVSVTTSTSMQFGFGSDKNYAGNLVPFGAGVIYEENPTISYVPVGGDEYMDALMSPIDLQTLAQLSGNAFDPSLIVIALVSSINGIKNPDFSFPGAEPDPRFLRVVDIISQLAQLNRLHWVESSAGGFSVFIEPDGSTAEVTELLELLDIAASPADDSALVLPVVQSLHGRGSNEIGISTRSVFELLEILVGAIEVPQQDQLDGNAVRAPLPGLAGERLHVRYSEDAPEQASVAVQYRDGWFYVAANDITTKIYFRLLGAVWSSAIAAGTSGNTAAPVLTVPVSR